MLATKNELFTAARSMLIDQRRIARAAINNYLHYSEAYSEARRAKAKMAAQGMTFLPVEKRLEIQREMLKHCRERMVEIGDKILQAVALWQCAGATIKDLCDLCGIRYNHAVKQIGHDHIDDDLADILFIHKLDYKHDFSDCGFYRMEVDAPFSHCITEYMLHKMSTDPVAKEASRQALKEVFPELAASAVTPVIDEFGETKYYDIDGCEVYPF